MTYRCVWTIPGTPFPAHVDHDDENTAHLSALRISRREGVEVAVIKIQEDE